MIIAFTLCSNNYLAHAKTLGDSFLQHHPDCKFIIGLVDKFAPDFDYSVLSTFEIITVDVLRIENFAQLNSKFTITELNTCVKPQFFKHIFQNYPCNKVIYLDPDILILSRFDEVLELLDNFNIIVTPHMMTPIDDEFTVNDLVILPSGIFNLGFLALSNYPKVEGFLNWWNDRLLKYGFMNIAKGMFYDQVWVNYVVTFYENYYILKHPGYNMANWNLHERILSNTSDSNYRVNNTFLLRFFHFSSYRYNKPEVISTYSNRFNFIKRPDLAILFNYYNTQLINNNVEHIVNLPVFYYPAKINETFDSLQQKLFKRLSRAGKIIVKGYE